MNHPHYSLELTVALQAVRIACIIARQAREEFNEEEDVTIKPDRSPVTVADYAVQAWINAALNAHFPSDPIMGEEDNYIPYYFQTEPFTERIIALVQAQRADFDETGILKAVGLATSTGGRAGRFWCLDPIDGTRGFIRGGQYAIALALIEDGDVKLGLLGCPNLPLNANDPDSEMGVIFTAVKGQGAFASNLSGTVSMPISVDSITDMKSAILGTPVEMGRVPREILNRFAHSSRIKAEPYRIDSQCKYAVLARGEISLYVRLPSTKKEHRGYIWDHSAGVLIVQEAGGIVTDLAGRALDFSQGQLLQSNRGILAVNPHLYAQVLENVHRYIPAELLEL